MTATRIIIDFETRSPCDLKKSGAQPYAEHPGTEVLWLCYRFRAGKDRGLVHSWRPGMADPVDLLEHVAAGRVTVAHNAPFEWCIWNLCLRGTHGHAWPELHTEQLDDTMARANVLALPAKLEHLAAALNMAVQKDGAGHRLMMQMAKPKPKDLKAGRVVYFDDDERRERLRQYCATDVEVECQLDELLPPLSPRERQIWEMDQRINIRGIAIDTASANAAHRIITADMAEANREIAALTGGDVATVNGHAALAGWLRRRGVSGATDTQAETIELLLESPHPDDVRRVLEIRRDSGKASVAKLPAMLAQTARDGRAHWLLAFAGAGRTLRWAGRGAQPQNLPRPDFKQAAIEEILGWLAAEHGRDIIEMLYGAPITVLSSCLRALFRAGPGKTLTASDLANIEGRVAAWLAGEAWKLAAFKAFDEKRGPDLYKVAYARTFGGRAEDVSDEGDDRQIGKIMELFLQYEGGQGAFATGANTYGFDILTAGQSPRPGRRSIPASIVPGAIKGWREAHPAIRGFWRELNTLSCRACEYPGEVFHTNNRAVSFQRRGTFLFMNLPDGSAIPYYKARTVPGMYGPALQYWGVNSVTKQWGELDTYGGKLFENAVQKIARNIFAGGMLRAEAANMPIVLHVHDAAVTEHVPGAYTAADLSRVLCDIEPVYTGLPVSAKGYTGTRFQK